MTIKKIMSSDAYNIVAEIIKKIEDEDFKVKVTEHFGREFNARSSYFDMGRWHQMTGVKMFREKPETEDERHARIMAYASKVTGREV